MALIAVTYTYNDLPELRAAHLSAHREFLGSLPGLVLSGPTSTGSALLLFEGDVDTESIETTLDDDPFRAVGLIDARQVFEWTPVLGSWKDTLGL
ncbi:hypothetical protein FB381_4555 [Nocardioides albertanoniae]|uniref:YCII-related domain-containing protein n=1 Tax=Nocardioides albertanoniae TaxID=1175486 RepID=A0A543ADN6_9ACTN|nr:hypothetical protein [Nocardioides albertanoniae]TQL70616.1 hypothetical protein FB381_4555 [Nocardioides albertanoniae]